MKSIANILVVIAVVFAFAGQTLEYASMSCNMLDISHENHMPMNHSLVQNSSESMDHSLMSMSMSKVNNGNSPDCCDTQCACPASACISILFLSGTYSSVKVAASSEVFQSLAFILPNTYSNSLYRPPIFA